MPISVLSSCRSNRINLLAGILLLLAMFPAHADHEPDHRYEVEGYLLDANRQPLPGIGLSISSSGQILGSTSSDSDGFYYLKLHLHDSSIGRKLVLNTADYSGTIIMTATAGDKTTRRLHYANFIAGKLVEGKLEGLATARWMYYAGGALLIIIILAVVAQRIKKRRKRHQRHAQKSAGARHHSKRRHRRKH